MFDREPSDPEPPGDPGEEPRLGGRLLGTLRALAIAIEPALVLILALGVATLLGAPFVPDQTGVAFPLRPEPGEARMADDDLVERARALELAATVEIRLMRGGEHLVLERPVEREGIEAEVHPLLRVAGYRATTPAPALPSDLGVLFEGRPTRLAALLSLQALALLAAALAMIRFRLVRVVRLAAGHGRSAAEGVLAGIAMVAASAALTQLLSMIGMPVEEQAWIERLFEARSSWLPLVPWLLVIGPVAEELFFRGYMFRFLRQQLGVSPAIVLSSLLFATIHANLSGVPVYLAIGAILAYVYHRTGNLLAPIVAHVLLNAVALGASTGAFGV